MIVRCLGARGSVPVSGPAHKKYGGNTTCWSIKSSRLAEGHHLIVDGGSGLVPLSANLLTSGVKSVTIVFTHYHIDHLNGIGLSPLMYMKHIPKKLFGPRDGDFGVMEAMHYIFQKPFFPVTDEQIKSSFVNLLDRGIASNYILVFYEDLCTSVTLSQYEKIVSTKHDHGQIEFERDGKKLKVDLHKVLFCRNIEMAHPDKCVSYRFEEYDADGKLASCFVLLTDCEAQSGVPSFYKQHISGAGLLAIDCQYSTEDYQKAAGFGHGSPEWVSLIAASNNIPLIGIVHHDPGSTDEKVDFVVTQCKSAAEKRGVNLRNQHIFAIPDYREFSL